MTIVDIALEQLAGAIGAHVDGDAGARARGICALDDLRPGCVVFLEKPRDAARLQGAAPAAVICSNHIDLPGYNLLRCDNPRAAFARALRVFHPEPEAAPGAHPAAAVHETATLGAGVSVAACAVVGPGARIGANTRIGAGCVVGGGVSMGENCVLHPNSTVLDNCELGARVILHSGAVIGADGFGYMQQDGEHVKMPQVGRVVIEDDVEIGANSCVDRATIGETRIGAGTKIDNLVQIGHNCRIGRGVIICGGAGISGSCDVGDGAVLAGQAGVADHVTIGARAIIGGKSAVMNNVPAGKFYSGIPAAPHRETMKAYSLIARLQEFSARVSAISEDLEDLKKKQ